MYFRQLEASLDLPYSKQQSTGPYLESRPVHITMFYYFNDYFNIILYQSLCRYTEL